MVGDDTGERREGERGVDVPAGVWLAALCGGLYPQFEERVHRVSTGNATAIRDVNRSDRTSNHVNGRSNHHHHRIGEVLLGVNPVHAALPRIATADPRKYASQRMTSKMDG